LHRILPLIDPRRPGRLIKGAGTEGTMNTGTKKSIGAVAAGVLAIIIVTTIVDVVLHAIHVYPPLDKPIDNALALLATAYRVVISIGGAYLTARLAPDRPLRHAMILGMVGVVLGLAGAAATWDLGLGPRWYPVALVILAVPQCWVGGKLWEMRAARRRAGRSNAKPVH
jgi:hypothetical protein